MIKGIFTMITMVITGCVSPEKDVPFLAVRSEEERLREYISCMIWAIQKTSVDKIIYVDTNGFDLSKVEELRNILQQTKKTIEFLSFKANSKMVEEKGKGYGEGQALEYVLRESKVIETEKDVLLKLTGRLMIGNIESIITKMNISTLRENNIVINLNYPASDMYDTRFYAVRWNTYALYLKKAYCEVDDRNWVCLEHVFFNKIKKNRLKAICTKEYPQFIGRSGSTGKMYMPSAHGTLNIMCKLRILNCPYIAKIVRSLKRASGNN